MGWRAPWSSLISGNDLIHSNPLGTARFKNFFLQGCTLKASPQNDKYLFLPSLSPLSPTAAETRWGQESRGLRTVPGCGCWNQGPPGGFIPLGTPVPALPQLRHPHPALPIGADLGIEMPSQQTLPNRFCPGCGLETTRAARARRIRSGAGTQPPGRPAFGRARWERGSGQEHRIREPH